MHLIIHTDGSARGNPGPGGIGVVIREDTEQGLVLLEEHQSSLEHTTNNAAEYEAILWALRRAAELGAEELVIKSDSELCVKQMNGNYRVNETLAPLYREALRLKRLLRARDCECVFIHIYRTENLDADRLSKKASGAAVPMGLRKRRGT